MKRKREENQKKRRMMTNPEGSLLLSVPLSIQLLKTFVSTSIPPETKGEEEPTDNHLLTI